MKKKLVSILLIVVIVFNFILCNCVNAVEDIVQEASESDKDSSSIISSEAVRSLIFNGMDSNGNVFSLNIFGAVWSGVALQYLADVINSLPIMLQNVMSFVTMNPKNAGEDNSVIQNTLSLLNIAEIINYHFTVEKAVFNEVSIFNINIFNVENTYELGLVEKETINQSQTNILLKKSVAGWFYICRMLAIMLNVVVLIYVGIRMAISSVASQEAKYKKMLIDWAGSMLVIFLLPYIIVSFIGVGEVLENIIYSIKQSMVEAGGITFEETILKKIYWAFAYKGGIQFFMYSLFFWFLTYIQGKFFFAYFKRMLTVMFLTMISPFITVTYPIDKMGDGKAQAFEGWFKEYLINIVVQPIHAAIYIIFVFTAGVIAEKAPFVAMIFLLTLGRIENIVRNIFGLTDSLTMRRIEMKRGKK